MAARIYETSRDRGDQEVGAVAKDSRIEDAPRERVGVMRYGPWQPLRRIVSRQTIQRMDICRRNVNALAELGKNKKGRGDIENF